MPRIATHRGITMEYEILRRPADPALLLVMGFGTQLIGWPASALRRDPRTHRPDPVVTRGRLPVNPARRDGRRWRCRVG
jgi:hypothetical protein